MFGKKKKGGGHSIFDDQKVGSHKMTTDSVFILLKKTDFNTILACVGDKVYQWWWGGGVRIFVAEMRGVAVLLTPTVCKLWTPPILKKMISP